MHRTLARQLRKLGLAPTSPPEQQGWTTFLDAVSLAYTSNDEDRNMIERAMAVSSAEMRELMTRLEERNRSLQGEIDRHAQTTERLRYAATHDQLTGLCSRATLLEELSRCVRKMQARGSTDNSKGYALLFIDLDDFKLINDSLGHDIGDQVLVGLARRLEEVCTKRPSLGPMICRLGGDEFVILLRSASDPGQVERAAAAIQDALKSPILAGQHRLVLSASIGLLAGDSTHRDAGDVLRNADLAMYHAKTTGKGRHALFDSGMYTRSLQRLTTEQELRAAIDHDQLELVYQPVINLESGRIRAVESLVRWNHPERGPMSPADFIDIAEKTGLIVPMGTKIFEMSARDLLTWRNAGVDRDDLSINVNISRRQLIDGNVMADMEAAGSHAGVPASRFILEVTENSVVSDTEKAAQVLARLRETGAKIYMDDFGTGLSSLSCLHQMPFDAVKIDRSFVSRVNNERGPAAVVVSIVGLAHNLGMRVVAEGVETVAQLSLLQACDCDDAQGYFFAKPMRNREFIDWLSRHRAEFDGHSFMNGRAAA
jgi:diguanylate cyclase (GGDEF)-like protein